MSGIDREEIEPSAIYDWEKENDFPKPQAAKILGEKINSLRQHASKKRFQAGAWFAGASLVGASVAFIGETTPVADGIRAIGFGTSVGLGYASASEARDSAYEASQLMAMHQYDMYEKLQAGEQAVVETSGQSPGQPQ